MRLAGIIAIAAVSMASPAFAHAFLERAQPPVGSEMAAPPPQIVLTFTEGVEPLFSTVELRGPNGSAVSTQKPHSPPDNARQLVIDLPPLPSGEYTVIWHVTSVDTHKTEGSFRFTIH